MAYLESIMIGISIAAIPGPIFFELVRRTLTRGFWHGALLAVGEFLGNFALLSLIFFGVSQFLATMVSMIILYFVGAVILVFLGYSAFRFKAEGKDRPKIAIDDSILAGFLVAITSPIVLALWISLSGSYLSRYESKSLAFFNVFLISSGFLVFFLPLAAVVHKIKRNILGKYVTFLSKLFGTVLIFYGAYFFLKLIRLLSSSL